MRPFYISLLSYLGTGFVALIEGRGGGFYAVRAFYV